MNSAFKTVAIAGASGGVGSAVIPPLLEAGFTVTALAREGSKATFPSGVKVVHLDYSSEEAVTAALKGQDVVIAALNPMGMGAQPLLINVAAKVGVKRFVPCEWGGDTTTPLVEGYQVLQVKRDVQALLRQKHAETGLTWTLFFTGLFLEYTTSVDFFINYQNGEVTTYDGGNYPASITSLGTVGKAVAAALLKPQETENKSLYIQDTQITFNKLFGFVQKHTPGTDWKVTDKDLQKEIAAASEAIANGAPLMPTALPQVVATVFGPAEYGQPWGPKNSMPLLGLKEMSDAEIEQRVEEGIEARQKA